MKGVKESAKIKINVKRSIFIASTSRVNSVDEAREFISMKKREFRDATHNCWAFRVFESGQILEGHSDAGEPSGTAGVPILNAIREKGLVNTVIVVTRYFGGAKLGVRGLIDAYHRAAESVLDEAGYVSIKLLEEFEVVVPFEKYGEVKSAISRSGSKIEKETFGENVKIVYLSSNPVVKDSKKIGERFVVEW